MNLIEIISMVLVASIFLTDFSLGLRASPQEAISLFRRPSLFLRSLTVMAILMPAFAIAIARCFELNPAVKIALVALSLSPIPPLLPMKQLKAGGSQAYTVALLVTAAVLSIFMIPLALHLLGEFFHLALQISAFAVTKLVMMTVLVPLAAGMLVKRLAPQKAERIVGPIGKIAMLALAISCLPVVFIAGPSIWDTIGNGTVLAFIAFTLLGMAVGHLLGGPVKENRVVLALSSASRHPGIAWAIASSNFPEQKKHVLAAILLYLIVNALTTLPYLLRKQRAVS